MGFGGGNMQKLMKQAQKMQSDMAKLQEELGSMTVEASSGGGMVTVVANGKQDIVSVKIKPEAVDPDDVEMLEDLLLAAITEARGRAGKWLIQK
jgi:DNA-binding YbaB/EbfC family protein